MNSVHSPVVAGTFYPGEESELRSTLERLMANARTRVENEGAGEGHAALRAIIAPHAGYIYSGPVAATAYAHLARSVEHWKDAVGSSAKPRIILLGPSHRVGFRGMALPGTEGYETPLGIVELDGDLCRRLSASPLVNAMPAAHAAEHSLEVHVPFLQYVLGEFTLVPLVVGRMTPREIADALAPVLDEPDVFIVVSSDLSHFLDYENARRKDAETSRAILEMQPDRIGPEEACGCRPVNGLLLAARERGWRPRLADLRSSGDTAGDKKRVVGYGAYLVG